MTPMTISGHVVNGQILPEQSVAALEGQRVIVTLTVVPKEPANGQTVAPSPDQKTDEEFDPEPPSWLQVENDVYFPIKVPRISLGKVNIRVREGKPSIILPEDLPDE